MVAGLVVAAIGGYIGLHLSSAQTQPPAAPAPARAKQAILMHISTAPPLKADKPVRRFVDDPARGLYWKGLRSNPSGQCGTLLEAIDSKGIFRGCTHGPDPTPAGVDARDSVPPVTADETSTNNIACEGDGSSGNRVQGLYVHAANIPSRYTQYKDSFQEFARRANTLMIESAYINGGEGRSIRFVTDSGNAGCKITVPEVTIPAGTDAEYGDTLAALTDKGYNRTDRKYMVWVDHDYGLDSSPACGWSLVGGVSSTGAGDDSIGSSNRANKGPTFGMTGSSCWGRGTEAHELLHSVGAVQNSAPNTNKNNHCNDEWDRMCQQENDQVLRYVCPVSQNNIFDCNGNDYFNSSSNIPSSNYLSNHWNSANNAYFIKGGTPPRDSLPPYPLLVYSPSTTKDNVGVVNARIAAEDNVGIKHVDFQVDDGPIDSQTTTVPDQDGDPNPYYYQVPVDTTKLVDGQHKLTVYEYDLDENWWGGYILFNTKNGNVPPPTPPPTTPPPTTPPPTTPPPTTPPPTTPPKIGDVNGDGKVNITDLSQLLGAWGTDKASADFNKSGKVDITDLSQLLGHWG